MRVTYLNHGHSSVSAAQAVPAVPPAVPAVLVVPSAVPAVLVVPSAVPSAVPAVPRHDRIAERRERLSNIVVSIVSPVWGETTTPAPLLIHSFMADLS